MSENLVTDLPLIADRSPYPFVPASIEIRFGRFPGEQGNWMVLWDPIKSLQVCTFRDDKAAQISVETVRYMWKSLSEARRNLTNDFANRRKERRLRTGK